MTLMAQDQSVRTVSIVKMWPVAAGRVGCVGRDADECQYRFLLQKRHGVPALGEVWEFSGQTEESLFGPQMRVESACYRQPDGRLLIGFLARHEAFRGARIGMARASALWEAFGTRLYQVLDSADAEALKTVDRLPSESIPLLLAAWQQVKAHGAVVRWLADKGFPVRLARRILDIYGPSAVAKLNDNPYRLLAFCSFAECEVAAQRMGIAQTDPRRLAAASQEATYSELNDGHTVTPRGLFLHRLERIVSDPVLAERSMHYGLETGAIIETKEGISSRGIRALENEAMRLMGTFLVPVDEHVPQLPMPSQVKIEAAIAACEREVGYALNAEQRQAVLNPFIHRVSILCGGAGTGKTTVLRAVCRAQAKGMFMMALAGQAARRMTQATGIKATTIEYFLRRIATKQEDISGCLIVVDESSMLDLATMVRLLRMLHSSCRLLLLGDPHQLPPVGFGLIFHRLAQASTVPRVELRAVMRQGSGSSIPGVSAKIRHGVVPNLPPSSTPHVDVGFDSCPRSEVIERLFTLKQSIPEAVILCPRNSGGLGVADINSFFHEKLHGDDETEPQTGISAGEPVIFKKNVSELDLVNGSVGQAILVMHAEENGWIVECDFDGRRVKVSGQHLEHLKLAYSLTVHSAQGSQFSNVIVVSEASRVLDRTWVYTAVTRAVHRVIVIGDQGAFARAIVAPPMAAARRVVFSAS